MTIAIAQTGAPTPVVNRSLAGFLDGAGREPVLFARGGPDALVSGSLTRERPSDDELRGAGSWLRGGRRRMTDADLDAAADALGEAGVSALVLIGGNGTMALLEAIAARADRRGHGLRAIGIPKTIDNDIVGIDHTPGFPSAARFLASTLTDMARDHEAMAGIERVRIVEVMGRDTGWLALAATAHDHDPLHAPDLVLLPETGFDEERWLEDVDRVLSARGRALVVVSEGVAPELTRQPVQERNHTRLIHGGISRVLAGMAADALEVPARGEVVGTAQRCSSALTSPVDASEAHAVGAMAGRWAADPGGPTGVMAAIGAGDETALPLGEVAGRTRSVPDEWRLTDPRELRSFHDWLSPLIALP